MERGAHTVDEVVFVGELDEARIIDEEEKTRGERTTLGGVEKAQAAAAEDGGLVGGKGIVYDAVKFAGGLHAAASLIHLAGAVDEVFDAFARMSRDTNDRGKRKERQFLAHPLDEGTLVSAVFDEIPFVDANDAATAGVGDGGGNFFVGDGDTGFSV